MRSFNSLCDRDAAIAIDAIRKALEERGKPAVIAVVDAHGELLALLRMSGAALSSITVATNKAYTSARLRRPSAEVGQRVRHPDNGIDISYYGDPRLTGFGGGLPAVIGGAVAGAVAVSGLTDAEDEELSALGIAAILAAHSSAAS